MAKMETCLVFFYFLKQDRTVVLEGRSFDKQGYRLWRVICSKPQVASDSIKPTPWVSWDLDVCTPLFASVRLLSGTQLRQCCQLSWMATPCIPKNSNVYQKVTPFSQPFFVVLLRMVLERTPACSPTSEVEKIVQISAGLCNKKNKSNEWVSDSK